MNFEHLEAKLSELPLYGYFFLKTRDLTFTERVRWICQHECQMYGKTWACPPGCGLCGGLSGQMHGLPGLPPDLHRH